VVLESNDSDIVKIFTGSEVVVFNRHDRLPISFRVMGRATKRILKAVHGLIQLAAQFNFQRFAASREQVEEQHCEQRHIATNQRSVRSGGS
jgi:hypothetical protein